MSALLNIIHQKRAKNLSYQLSIRRDNISGEFYAFLDGKQVVFDEPALDAWEARNFADEKLKEIYFQANNRN